MEAGEASAGRPLESYSRRLSADGAAAPESPAKGDERWRARGERRAGVAREG